MSYFDIQLRLKITAMICLLAVLVNFAILSPDGLFEYRGAECTNIIDVFQCVQSSVLLQSSAIRDHKMDTNIDSNYPLDMLIMDEVLVVQQRDGARSSCCTHNHKLNPLKADKDSYTILEYKFDPTDISKDDIASDGASLVGIVLWALSRLTVHTTSLLNMSSTKPIDTVLVIDSLISMYHRLANIWKSSFLGANLLLEHRVMVGEMRVDLVLGNVWEWSKPHMEEMFGIWDAMFVFFAPLSSAHNGSVEVRVAV